jgi:uncharacterized protein (TIGR04255 family)
LQHPPIIELVLGVQFAPLTSFTNGHFGWFWKRYLEDEWVRGTDAIAIADQFETFDERRRWGMPDLRLLMSVSPPPVRFQLSNASGDRMIQVQPTRFHYNWQKKGQAYPSYRQVRAGFDDYFTRFRHFVAEAGLGKVVPNQWEVTYVDQIPRGPLWQSPRDWHDVLPGLFAPQSAVEGIHLETFGGEWHYEIAPQRGRLHLSIQYGKLDEEGEQVLRIQTTTRGPIGKEADSDLKAGLDLGHEMSLRAFFDLTSPAAQKCWGIVGP